MMLAKPVAPVQGTSGVINKTPPTLSLILGRAAVGLNGRRMIAAATTNNNPFLRVSAYNLTPMPIVKKGVGGGVRMGDGMM